MILPGHIAVAILCHKWLGVDLPTTIAATVVPDAVDKGLAQVLHVTPNGRYAMHSLAGWLASSWLASRLGGRRRGRAWALSHMAHFLGDQGRIPWWLPFKRYKLARSQDLDEFLLGLFSTSEGRRNLLLETLFLVLALLAPSLRDRSPAAERKGARA